MILQINGIDVSDRVSSLKIGYETLVSSDSGRNAAGDTVIDVINKKYKLYVTFRHTTAIEMDELLNTIRNYVVTVEFQNPFDNAITTITAYTGTPEPEYYTKQANLTIYKPMNLNFIEL